MKEMKSFAEDNILSKLSESEAAKRLAIGTKTGKYIFIIIFVKLFLICIMTKH